MKNINWRTVFSVFISIIVYAAAMQQWYTNYYIGNQSAHVDAFQNALIATTPIWALFEAIMVFYIVRFVLNDMLPILTGLVLLLGAQSCSERAKANQQTLYTSDCGVTWDAIKPGESIPKCTMGYCGCSYRVTIPDYPMQGDAKFKVMFSGKVLAWVNADYDFEIFDGEKFVQEAKYIGKMGSSADDSSNASGAYETAENMVIDKRIREAITTFAPNEDIVDFEPSVLEEKVLVKCNELLASKGVKLNFLVLVPQFDEQTRTAIDAATAARIYKSRGMDSLGALIMSARAGATKIIIGEDKNE